MTSIVGTLQRLADQGSHELAADLFLTLMLGSRNPRGWTGSTPTQAGQAAYLLALQLLQVGSIRLAEALLQCLGCTHRLADTILLHKTAPPLQQSAGMQPLLEGPGVLLDALPESMFRQVQEGFLREAPYWQQSGYNDHDHPFHSFLYPLADPAVGQIEAAIQCCKERLSQGGCDTSRIKAAEWWAHRRAATDAHQLHFDLDETRLGAGPANYQLRHPLYSTVLYLTDFGGPTVVLGQTPSSKLAQDAWLCWPRANSLLCFPGNYLHGVIPGMPPEQDPGGQRITLVVVFWAVEVRPQPGLPGSGPMRALPSACSLRSALGPAGLHDSGQGGRIRLGAHRQYGDWMAATHVVQPWKNVTAELLDEHSRNLARARSGPQLQIMFPPLRFFLLSPEEIPDTYHPEHPRDS